VRIHFTFPGTDNWDKFRDLPSVPRVGDTVDFGDGNISDEYTVKHVTWYPNNADRDSPIYSIDAYVVLRS
jgi:hypothetical protein